MTKHKAERVATLKKILYEKLQLEIPRPNIEYIASKFNSAYEKGDAV
jgi:hypothetical protein